MMKANTRDPRGAIIDFLGYQIATHFLGYVDTCDEHAEEIRAWAHDGHVRPRLEEIADAILAIAIPDEPRLQAALAAERAKVAALAAALAFYADRETWRGESPKAPIHRDCDGDMAAVPGLRARVALAGTDPAAWDRGQQTADPELQALIAAYDRWRAACAGKPEDGR